MAGINPDQELDIFIKVCFRRSPHYCSSQWVILFMKIPRVSIA